MYKTRKKGKWVILPLHTLWNGKPKMMIEQLLAVKRKNMSSPGGQVTWVETPAQDNRIFPSLSSEYIRRQLKEIARITGLQKNISPHTARHTFGTLGAEFIKDLTLLRELMGHSKIETTMVYAKRSTDRMNDQLKKVDWERKSE
jgi:integrase